MAVPAHDERDLEFAQKYDLSVQSVLDERGVLILACSTTPVG